MPRQSVRFSATPNPNAGKFTLPRAVFDPDHGQTFASLAEATGNPIAERLLAVGGVESVFMVADFVTVIKTHSAVWKELEPRVRAVLAEVS